MNIVIISLSSYIYSMFHKLYAYLHLTIALVVVQWCHNLVCVHAPAKIFKLLWNKIHAYILNQFSG